jgi:hypothetical protein
MLIIGQTAAGAGGNGHHWLSILRSQTSFLADRLKPLLQLDWYSVGSNSSCEGNPVWWCVANPFRWRGIVQNTFLGTNPRAED